VCVSSHNVHAYIATRKWRVLKVTPQVVTPGAESAVYDCLTEHLVAFTAKFGKVFTARAQKRLFMNFGCKIRYRRSIPRPRFTCRVRNVGDLKTFFIGFGILHADSPPYFYFRFLDYWPIKYSLLLAPAPMAIISTKFKIDTKIYCRVIVLLLHIRYITL